MAQDSISPDQPKFGKETEGPYHFTSSRRQPKSSFEVSAFFATCLCGGDEVYRQCIHSFHVNILRAYKVPSTILGTGNTTGNKIKLLCPQLLHSSGQDRQQTNKQLGECVWMHVCTDAKMCAHTCYMCTCVENVCMCGCMCLHVYVCTSRQAF